MALKQLVEKGLKNKTLFEKHFLEQNTFFPNSDPFVVINEDSNNITIGKCIRALYYEKMEALEKQFDARVLMKFEDGLGFEKIVCSALQRTGNFLADHVKIKFPYKNIRISGEVDLIATTSDGETVGVELKTGTGYYFQQQVFYGYKNEPTVEREYIVNQLQAAPIVEHLMQAGIYLYYYQNIFKSKKELTNINKWFLLYKDNETSEMAEYIVYLTIDSKDSKHYINTAKLNETGNYDAIALKPIAIEDIFENFVMTQNYIDISVLPPRSYNPSYTDEEIDELLEKKLLSKNKHKEMKAGKIEKMHYKCAYCQFLSLCLQNKEIIRDEEPLPIVQNVL